MREGTGQIIVNNRHWMYYFKDAYWRHHIISPLLATEMINKFDFKVLVRGGGLNGSYSFIFTHSLRFILYNIITSHFTPHNHTIYLSYIFVFSSHNTSKE
jgi:hypothetical protein